MNNIILIGMPGSGKSTFGKLLSQTLGKTFIDADTYLEEKEGKTIKELFTIGEDYFRDAEERAIFDLSKKNELIIATGGGVVKRGINIEHLKQSGMIVFIDRHPDDIITDVEVGTRPLLAKGAERVYELYHERITLYRESADATVVNKGPREDVLDRIIKLCKS